ncbi:MAG TPA: flagellar biosynthesis anti-sigma factor FlgM [Sphingomonas sp.]
MDGIDKAGSAADVTRLASTPGAALATQPVAATAAATAVAAGTTTDTTADATVSLLSVLADAAPPIDSKKVEAIQSLIASGAYPIDPHAIAAKMLALDFPKNGASADA